MRTPTASLIALAIAAATGTTGGSPTPLAPNGPSSDGTSTSRGVDRKSTRLNSSHVSISYAVFCLKKKKKKKNNTNIQKYNIYPNDTHKINLHCSRFEHN